MEKLVIIISIIFIIILLSRIRIVISKEVNEKININIYLFPKIGVKLNLNKFFTRYKNKTFNEKINNLKNDLTTTFENKNLIIDVLKIIRIRKIYIDIYYDFITVPNIYIYFIIWNLLSITKNYLDNHVRSVNEEKYMIYVDTRTNDIKVYLDIIFPTVFLIFIFLKNIISIMKGIKKYGSSNK